MSKPVLEAAAQRMENNLEIGGVYGFDITILIQLLPALIGLFQSCKKKPEPQPNPIPSPTPAQTKAWDMKCTAINGYIADEADYQGPLLRRTARECKRTRRKDGNPCSHAESVELARASLDEARTQDVHTLAAAIEEADA